MKSPLLPHRFLLVSAAIAATGLAVSAGATTYYFGPSSSSAYADYGDPNNWFLDQACTTPAGSIPTASDSLRPYNYHYMDFGGNEYSIGSLDWPSGSWQYRFYMKNGGLLFTGSPNPHYEGFYLEENASLRFSPNTSFTPGYNDGGCFIISVKNGSSFEFDNAVWNIHHVEIRNDSGGTVYFNPSELGVTGHNFDAPIKNASGATMTLPSGIVCSKGQNGHIQLQNSGTLTIGGPLSYGNTTTKLSVTFSGGTVNVTGPVSTKLTAASFSGATVMNFANGAYFDASSFTAESGASITMTGAGTLAIPIDPPSLTVGQGGTIELGASGATDLSNVVFSQGTSLKVGVANGRVDSADPSLLANATFTADLSGANLGDVVFSSSDADIRSAAKTALVAALPQGLTLVESGDALMVEAVSDYVFNSTSVSDLLNASGWNTGSVPPDGVDVAIDGANVVATYSSGTLPAWENIEVKNGATLRIATDSTPPPIILNKAATLDIAAGTTTLANGLTCTANTTVSPVILPVLSVQSGAKLTVPANTKFKNVDIRLFGSIEESSMGFLYFGYAESGETTHFAMCATNATIKTIGSGSYGNGQLCFVCPASGGTVSVIRPIDLDGLTYSHSNYDGMYVGVNNPITAPFNICFTRFSAEYRGYWSFNGAATVIFRNSSLSRPAWQAWSAQGRWNVEGLAKLIYDNTTHYYEYPDGNSVNWSPAEDGVECFVLTNSTVMWTRPTGNYQGTMTVYDSFYDCAYDAYAPSQGRTLPDLFKGLGVLNIPAGSFCAIRAKDHVTWDKNDDATERICKIDSGVLFAGAGDLVISNSVSGRYFEVTMQSGNNTCVGTASVSSPEGFDAKLLFADGANWAGTVLATSGVSFTNLTSATGPAAVSFGGVELVDDTFKLRLWADGTSDSIAIGEGGWTGTGKLGFEFVGGFSPTGAEAWKIGSQPVGTVLPAALKSYYLLYTKPSATEGVVDIYLKTPKGTAILLR